MEKSDKMILKAFYSTKIPTDFYNTINKIMIIDTVLGYTNQAINGSCVKKEEVIGANLSEEENREFEIISSGSLDNKRFYYLLKLVIVILSKYAI